MLFVGDDWAEGHHDVELMDPAGRRLAKARLPEGVAGIARLHAMIGEHLGEDDETDEAEVLIGIETDRGPWVAGLIAAGYTVFAVNPLSVASYRKRHSVSGAKRGRSMRILAGTRTLRSSCPRRVWGRSSVPGCSPSSVMTPTVTPTLSASRAARAYYDKQRTRGAYHNAALRQLANRPVGILHFCLKTRTLYDEATAWSHRVEKVAA